MAAKFIEVPKRSPAFATNREQSFGENFSRTVGASEGATNESVTKNTKNSVS